MLSPGASLKRFCVAMATFCVCFACILPAFAESVRVITSSEMDFPAGQQSVQVELRASGYTVTVEQTDALEPGKLLEELQTETSEAIVATVAVVRLGRGGIAYVWLSEAKQMYRVTSSETDSARAANVLSLRVVELISLRGSGYEVEHAAPDRKREVQAAPKAPREVESPRARSKPWMLWGALGPQFGSGLRTPLASAHLGLTRSVGDIIALSVNGYFSLGAASQRFDQGDLRIWDRGLSLAALVQSSGRPLRWQLGPTGGFRCVHLRSRSNDDSAPAPVSENVCGPTLGALLRVGVQWEYFSLWMAGLGSLGTQRIDLLADDEILATLGRPDGWVGLMMGWQF